MNFTEFRELCLYLHKPTYLCNIITLTFDRYIIVIILLLSNITIPICKCYNFHRCTEYLEYLSDVGFFLN